MDDRDHRDATALTPVAAGGIQAFQPVRAETNRDRRRRERSGANLRTAVYHGRPVEPMGENTIDVTSGVRIVTVSKSLRG